MKPFENYHNRKVPYPCKRNYVTLYAYDAGQVVWEGPLGEMYQDLKDSLKRLHPGVVFQEKVDEDKYLLDRQKYNEEEAFLYEMFKKDLFEEFGVSENPKRERLFAHAWDRGHAAGYSDVYNVFADLVDLIQD